MSTTYHSNLVLLVQNTTPESALYCTKLFKFTSPFPPTPFVHQPSWPGAASSAGALPLNWSRVSLGIAAAGAMEGRKVNVRRVDVDLGAMLAHLGSLAMSG